MTQGAHMPTDDEMQRALQLAGYAKADRIRAQATLLACIRKEEDAAKEAHRLARALMEART